MSEGLGKAERAKLESGIASARQEAEAGARAALLHLGVEEPEAPSHLTPEQAELRKRLRARGRQLGDKKQLDGTQEAGLLIEEIAYEHWHRMLFSRFLAENGLLIYRTEAGPLPVSMRGCEDLGREKGKDKWEYAAELASGMLPQIFRLDSPVFGIEMPPERKDKLEKILEDIPREAFTADDSLGWVYQFWQSKRKEEINKAGVKIGARELPAVTQLFTEGYMVSFLLDNTLGAWWAMKKLNPEALRNAEDEEELRSKCRIEGVPLKYLRFVKEEGSWRPAGGSFSEWPERLSELKVLDPCCGSGHFLVAAMRMLVPMRMELEGIGVSEAISLVIKENLHGLELDRRCVELGAFNLAFTAWRYPNSGGYRALPSMRLACSGLSPGSTKSDFVRSIGTGKKLGITPEMAYELFEMAPILGSMINPRRDLAVRALEDEWQKLSQSLDEKGPQAGYEESEAAVAAKGLSDAAQILGGQYHLVITNPPYLGSRKQAPVLKAYLEEKYNEGKTDLATAFLSRCLEFCHASGTCGLVLPQNWLFLKSYEKLRKTILRDNTFRTAALLGPGAFETISGEVVKAILLTLSKATPGEGGGLYSEGKNKFAGIDVSGLYTPGQKDIGLQEDEMVLLEQAKQVDNPDSRIVLEVLAEGPLLSESSDCYVGIQSGDYPRLGRYYWESAGTNNMDWEFQQSTVEKTDIYDGRSQLLLWENGEGALSKSRSSRVQGLIAIDNKGIAASQMGQLPVSLFTGDFFDNNTAVIIPKDPLHLPAIWCYCSSEDYNKDVRKIDQALKVTNSTLVKVPFDLEYWRKVAEEKYPNGLPKSYSDDPTQWIFHGHPCGSVIWDEDKKWTALGPDRTDNTVLQVAVARLLGYRWPAETDPTMELSDEARVLVNRSAGLLSHADKDGIVCIPSVKGESGAEQRLKDLLADTYGESWNLRRLNELLKSVGYEDMSLEKWLRDGFFSQHCKLFLHRPFIWQVWDGLKDGFSALVNYHKLDHELLMKLIYTYLGGWISQQKQGVKDGVPGSEERLDAAEDLQAKLLLILEGEDPYDIFVRWKPLEEQPIGWRPDIDDGVRLNIRPFMKAGVLRHNSKPNLNISWDKDRGKDTEDSPWYSIFKGERINDYHLKLSDKGNRRNLG